MIDSVVIKIPDFVLYSDRCFTRLKYQEFKGQYGVFGRFYTQHSTYPQELKKQGVYYPQADIIQRHRRIKDGGGRFSKQRYLLVQVSVPKLIYGVSIFDVNETLIPVFATKLRQALLAIHIEVSEENILNAIVQRVDYSKIIRTSPSYGSGIAIIHELGKYNTKQSSDFNQRDVRQGRDTSYIKFYNSSQGLVIYNKFDELTVNGTTRLDRSIAKGYQKGDMKYGALRIELSLQLKQTVDSVLRRYYSHKRSNFTLLEVAHTDIAQTVLLDTFEKVCVKGFAGAVFLSGLQEKDLLHAIGLYTSNYSQQAILYLLSHRIRNVGLKQAIKEMQAQVSNSTAGRYKKMVETVLKDAAAKHNRVNIVSYLHRKLKQFTPVMPKQLNATQITVEEVMQV